MLVVAALATWCWAADLHASATCTYDREQRLGIVKLRGGLCYPAGEYRRDLLAAPGCPRAALREVACAATPGASAGRPNATHALP
jgi:hypothetical protein